MPSPALQPSLTPPTTMSKNKAVNDLLPQSDSDYELASETSRAKISFLAADGLEDDFDSDSEQEQVFLTKKKTQIDRFEQDESDDDEAHVEKQAEVFTETKPKLDEDTALVAEQEKRATKLKRLTPEQLAKEQKKIKRTGVCYLSSIPPYMKPVKLRSVLSKFGKLDRIFLKPEDQGSYQKRVKYGGNKKKRFTEGWVEFVKKSDAKLCAQTMNGNILGGKKSSYYHDDIINIKYLPGFKWFDLTQQIAKENEVRQAKLSLEISQQSKLDKSFVNNVEKSKYINRKRKAAGDDAEEPKFKRTFDQRDISSTRADAKLSFKKEKNTGSLDDVLSKVF